MLMVPTSNNEAFSAVEFCQGEFVDFPVWVLKQCGLKIAPFNSHGLGFERLRALGIDSAAWELWFRKILISQHMGFQIQHYGIAPLVTRRRNETNADPFVYDGCTAVEASLETESPGMLEKYYETIGALSELSPSIELSLLSSVNDPVSLWPGNSHASDELAALWNRYRARPYYRVHHASDLRRLLVRDSVLCEEINAVVKTQLGPKNRFLMIHFVNYPKPIFTVRASSIVIGLDADKPFSIDEFKSVLRSSIAGFVSESSVIAI